MQLGFFTTRKVEVNEELNWVIKQIPCIGLCYVYYVVTKMFAFVWLHDLIRHKMDL